MERTTTDMNARLEKKRQSLELLKKDVGDLKVELKRRKEVKRVQKATKDIRFWMDNFVFPYLEGLSDSYNEPLLSGIRRLISEKKNPFRPSEGWDRTRESKTALTGLFRNPQAKVLLHVARPFIKNKIEWIQEQSDWVRETIIKKEYPEFYTTIVNIEGGKEWFNTIITDLVNTLKRSL